MEPKYSTLIILRFTDIQFKTRGFDTQIKSGRRYHSSFIHDIYRTATFISTFFAQMYGLSFLLDSQLVSSFVPLSLSWFVAERGQPELC